ncbi:hypothetical protein GCM10025865_30050 [Paraoerskovia sediminicola]|uniref:Uncharacterized protein n=1 Tax=Paraoerskovia sediminicola TaxID=1138587 RepID=A0ABN6XFU2_9CELL|nr:hypothetical protein [Paraoerskovia sediminicola]BDZ43706.1 hypothetical protein GCM10025865_30050 [Paraoerskovia sediminicola]
MNATGGSGIIDISRPATAAPDTATATTDTDVRDVAMDGREMGGAAVGGAAVGGAAAPDKAALARAVLRSAEQRAGVRREAPAPVTTLDRLRRAPALRRAVEVRQSEVSPTSERYWPVHPDLACLLPHGSLQRGTVVAVQGSTSLLLSLVAEASRAGAWTALLGHDRVGMVAAADAGIVLERTALVPAPGADAAAAAAALVDGVDVVVLGPQAAMTDADRRRLTARARERGSLLVPAGPWPGAHVALVAGTGRWNTLDHGAGWLRSRTLPVERTGRAGAARAERFEIDLPLRPLADSRAPGAVAGAPGAVAGAPGAVHDVPGPDLRLVG